ncbi:MAG: S1 RNA-binding domain-containing protein [Planctomycetes bacterium]|nr:S1 RNA-binding domain-containing protein [Planctomycetota bacterium]
MLETGSIVKATISNIVPYGVYLECSGDSIVVVASNLSWRGESEVDSELRIGEVIDVKIMGYSQEKQVYVGSCKDVRPGANPYNALSHSPLSDTHCGIVRVVHETGLSIQIGECIGNLPYDESSKSLRVGDEVLVAVTSVDPQREFLDLRLLES